MRMPDFLKKHLKQTGVQGDPPFGDESLLDY